MSLPAELYADLDARLGGTDALLATVFGGDDGRRQPVHTVYVPADRYTADLPRQWGRAALDLIDANGGITDVCATAGLTEELADQVGPRVLAKLEAEPIEDLRLDFEDGYGNRDEQAEDADAAGAARRLAAAIADGGAPAWYGPRFKCLEESTRRRGVRTLDLFLGTLLGAVGTLPPGLVITLPKVSTVDQVEAMVTVCAALEAGYGLPDGSLGFEIQVETPQLIIGPDGRIPVARAIQAGAGRVTALHYGTYDYSASLQIAADHQASDHPAADFAKQIMQVAAAGTTVHLSDGSTNLVPAGDRAQVHRVWRVHAGLVRRALERGFYQGWDMHPGHLPTRYAVAFGFYRAGLQRAGGRLRDYLTHTAGAVMDEPATARALARYLQRGHACGAVDETELTALTGLDAAAVAALARPRSDTDAAVPAHA